MCSPRRDKERYYQVVISTSRGRLCKKSKWESSKVSMSSAKTSSTTRVGGVPRASVVYYFQKFFIFLRF